MATFMNTVDERPNNPTALVYINGRALLCFSRANSQAEVGFLKIDECHELFVTIYRPGHDPIPDLLKPVKEITINSSRSGLGSLYYSVDSNNEADWDDEDFRHVLDFDEIHKIFTPGIMGRVKIKTGNSYLAELFINDATFFTATLSRNRGRIFAISGGLPSQPPLRRIGKIIGAQIDDEVVDIHIKFKDDSEQKITLQKENTPYEIMFRYKCATEIEGKSTDFEKFYNVLRLPPNHKELDFEYETIEPIEPIQRERDLLQLFSRKDAKLMSLIEKKPDLLKLLENIIAATEACQAATKSECPSNLRGTEPTLPPC
jgi:hypothetical protein